MSWRKIVKLAKNRKFCKFCKIRKPVIADVYLA